LGNLDRLGALLISVGLFVIVFSTIGVSYQDSHCAGKSGEDLILCLGDEEANASAGDCAGLSSLECLQKNIDTDGDKIHNEIDLCPNDPETFNGIQDEDGCPEDLPTLTPEEIKQAYDGLTNIFQEKVPEPILEEFQSIELPTPVESKLCLRLINLLVN